MPPATPYRFPSFDALLDRIARQRIASWAVIERAFLACVASFDAAFAAGNMTRGNYQAKGRYFNELLALLIANQTGRQIGLRGLRPGQGRLHEIDLAYPAQATALPFAIGESKAIGAPPHPGNVASAGAAGRKPGDDLNKRLYEIAYAARDLKLRQNPRSALSSRARERAANPLFVAFFAIRVTSPNELAKIAADLCVTRDHDTDGVGLFAYVPDGAATRYRAVSIPAGLRMDDALRAFSERIGKH